MKHRSTVYVVLRHDFSGNDSACAVTTDPEYADELKEQFSQSMRDVGCNDEEFYFYVSATAFYKHA